jgi:hypothetical protein
MGKRILAVFAALGIGLIAGIAVMVVLVFMIGQIEEGLFDLLFYQLEVYLPICLIVSILTQIINRPNGGRTAGLGVGVAGGILVPIIIFGTEIFYSLTDMISILYALAITLPLGYEAGSITQSIACNNGQ